MVAVLGALFLLLSIAILFRKKRDRKEYRVETYDSEDTILLKILIQIWRSAPNWFLSTILCLAGAYLLYVAIF